MQQNSQEEIWKDIPGYEGHYQASNKGRVRSLERTIKRRRNGILKCKSFILKSCENCHGYPCVSLFSKTVAVHRLVSLTFIPNPLNKRCINHKDGARNNNTVENLEWCTYSENMVHSFTVLKRFCHPGLKGKDHILSKPIISIDKNGTKIKYEAIQVAARKLNASAGNICLVLKGKRNHTKGLKFIYDQSA